MTRLALVALVTLGACAPAVPHWEARCLTYRTEQQWVYWPAEQSGLNATPYGVGLHVGGGMHLVTNTICSSSDSVWVVPKVKP